MIRNRKERLEKQARLKEIAKLIMDLKLERDKIEMEIVNYQEVRSLRQLHLGKNLKSGLKVRRVI